MLSIPITAECLKPKVDIFPKEKLDFGEVFLDFEEHKEITLTNAGNLHA
jgi:hypothetical protein